MNKVKFGNWSVTQEVIIWQQDKDGMSYEIPIDRLFERLNDSHIFDWLVHVPEKTWMTAKNTYNLNSSFMFAVEQYKLPIPDDMSIEATLSMQEVILDQKENPIS